VLVETGNGAKFTDNEREIYGLAPGGGIEAALSDVGVRPEAIDTVVITHLHFDHAGGATRRTSGGFEPVFRNARHVIQRGEFYDATHPHERNRAATSPRTSSPSRAPGSST